MRFMSRARKARSVAMELPHRGALRGSRTYLRMCSRTASSASVRDRPLSSSSSRREVVCMSRTKSPMVSRASCGGLITTSTPSSRLLCSLSWTRRSTAMSASRSRSRPVISQSIHTRQSFIMVSLRALKSLDEVNGGRAIWHDPRRVRCCPWVSIPDELARDSDAEDLVDPVVDTPDLEVGQNEHDKDDHGERRAPTTAAAPLLPWLVGLLGAEIVLLIKSATEVVGAVGAPRWLLGATGRWRSTGATHVGWETTRLACEPGRWGSTRPHRVAGVALWMVSVRARGRAEAAGRWWAAVVPGGRVTTRRGWGRGGAVARLRSGGGLRCGRKAAGVRGGGGSGGGDRE